MVGEALSTTVNPVFLLPNGYSTNFAVLDHWQDSFVSGCPYLSSSILSMVGRITKLYLDTFEVEHLLSYSHQSRLE